MSIAGTREQSSIDSFTFSSQTFSLDNKIDQQILHGIRYR